MKTQLWSHQNDMVRFIEERPYAFLHAKMGSGKTLAILKTIEGTRGRVLVVAPKKPLIAWKEQVDLHVETSQQDRYLNVLDLKGNTSEKTEAIRKHLRRDNAVVIINYDIIFREPLYTVLHKVGWDLMVADESHRIFAHNTASGRAVWLIGKQARKRVAMTGTPVRNSPLDYFGQVRFLDDRVFDNPQAAVYRRAGTRWTHFQNTYAFTRNIPGTNASYVVGFKNLDDLAERVAPFTYTVRTEDVIDLPPTRHIRLPVDLPPEVMRSYNNFKKDFVADFEQGLIKADNILTKTLRMQQIACGFIKDEIGEKLVHSEKIDALMQFLLDLPKYEPVVVFAKYIFDIELIKRTLNKHEILYASLRDDGHRALKDWNQDRAQVLITQIDSGAEGLNLTHARYGVFYSNTYSMGTYEQALARLCRPGADVNQEVLYYHIIARNTIDETVYKALTNKQDVAEALYQEIENSYS